MVVEPSSFILIFPFIRCASPTQKSSHLAMEKKGKEGFEAIMSFHTKTLPMPF